MNVLPAFLFILVNLLIFSCQPSPKNPASSANQIVAGTLDSLYSPTLKEQRKLWVYVPNSIGSATPSQKINYPVLYLLDGDAHFYSVMGMIHQLSLGNGNTVLPKMIIVAIANTERGRDLTPTKGEATGGARQQNYGGGEAFTTFIEKELIPYIDKTYPTTSYRTLVGHSLGGLLVVNTLVNRPDMFSSYVAIDPSLWWDNQKLLKKAVSVWNDKKFTGKSLYVASANTLEPRMDTTMALKDTSGSTQHFRSIIDFAKMAQSNPKNGLRFQWKYYAEDDHSSILLIATYDALHFLFSWYKFKEADRLVGDTTLTAETAMQLINSHYQLVSQRMGYTVHPTEGVINAFGYEFMGEKQMDKAYAFFKSNVTNYPQSANVYDSMGDYYVAQQDKAKATEFFTKALAIANTPDTKKKLAALQAEK